MERTETFKLPGVNVNELFKLENHVKTITSSCYGTLPVLRKLRHFATFPLRKQLVESLILSKVDYDD